MTDCRRLFFSVNPYRPKLKAGCLRLGWEDVAKKDLRKFELPERV